MYSLSQAARSCRTGISLILAALFPEAQCALFAEVAIVGEAQLRHGPDARAGIGEDAEHGAIAEADGVPVSIECNNFRACSMPSSAVLPSVTLYLMPRTEAKELSGDGMALHHGIEKIPQGRERLIFGGRGAFELADIFAGQARRDVAQLKLRSLRTSPEPPDDPAVSAPGVFVADAGLEKFLGSKSGVAARAGDGRRHWERDPHDQFVGSSVADSMPSFFRR